MRLQIDKQSYAPYVDRDGVKNFFLRQGLVICFDHIKLHFNDEEDAKVMADAIFKCLGVNHARQT